jgi:hypothetical protein
LLIDIGQIEVNCSNWTGVDCDDFVAVDVDGSLLFALDDDVLPAPMATPAPTLVCAVC